MAGSYDPRTFQALTFQDATPAFRDGSDSPRAYLERCLAAIAARDPVVRAFVVVNAEGARAAADESTARWRAGRPLSAVDGLPIGIKDLLETKDMPTEMGCEAYRGNFPRRDNAAVSALRRAGAVVMGKTTTAELGGAHPPATTNPFDAARTPGGSSSGSAAAVGAGMIPAAVGSQVGGSIVRPAAFCGNYALKPTQGGINRGERQTTSMSTHGIHAVLRIRLPLRPAEVRGGHDCRTSLEQPVDRGQRRADAEVVGDLAVLHRNVEVGTNQHALAADVAEVGERGDAAGHGYFFDCLRTLAPAYRVVSMRRLL